MFQDQRVLGAERLDGVVPGPGRPLTWRSVTPAAGFAELVGSDVPDPAGTAGPGLRPGASALGDGPDTAPVR
ncbi:hypothetical protein ACIF8T_36145 [Streptomyces sp. NPDC085946]|uniref:hypothetical protein n=1 Tax=Streptomyces sp. NPDC085946 TaxID=3365744 RepID=UPI0037D6F172